MGKELWGLLLLYLLLAGCVAAPQARSEGYRELAAWLEDNALPDESVGVQEPEAWARLTGLPLVALPADGAAAVLLESLAELRPDYCVALRSVSWEGVQASPWFRERYRRVASAAAVDDPLAPLTLYRYHPSPFETGETLLLGLTLQDEAVGHIAMDSVQLSSQRLESGEPVYVSLTLSGDVRESLRVEWLLRDSVSGRVWLRDAHGEPGGLPTDAWPVRGTVTERHIVAPPDDLPPGDYALELAFTRPNLAPFAEPVWVATLLRPPDVSRTPLSPDHPLDIAVGNAITLAGYDAPQRLPPGDTLRVALYWQVQDVVVEDLKVFVHLFSSEGTLVAQSDVVPVGWAYPTTAWQPGETVRDVHVISLDGELPRGDYRVVVGMYDPVTGERLALRDAGGLPIADDAAELFVLRVR
jgi:hypothetical protein